MNLGRLAFDTFAESRKLHGHDHVRWEDLLADVRTAWDEVGIAVKDHLSSDSCPWCGFRKESAN